MDGSAGERHRQILREGTTLAGDKVPELYERSLRRKGSVWDVQRFGGRSVITTEMMSPAVMPVFLRTASFKGRK